jgi:hypothetical protein
LYSHISAISGFTRAINDNAVLQEEITVHEGLLVCFRLHHYVTK